MHTLSAKCGQALALRFQVSPPGHGIIEKKLFRPCFVWQIGPVDVASTIVILRLHAGDLYTYTIATVLGYSQVR